MKSMKIKLLVVAACSLLMFGVSCRVRDIRTVEIEVPRLRGEQCIRYLQHVLGSLDGVDADRLLIEPGRVIITYDSMKLAIKNLEHTIARAGFDANEIPADPEARARLPEACR